jgi:hypothetical protein
MVLQIYNIFAPADLNILFAAGALDLIIPQ